MEYTLHLIFKDSDGKNTDIRVHYAKAPDQLSDNDVKSAMDSIISNGVLLSPSGNQLVQKVAAYDEGTQTHEFDIS